VFRAVVPEPDPRRGCLDVERPDVRDLEENLAAALLPGGDQVLDDFLLAVHGNGPAMCKVAEGDAVILAIKTQLDAAMDQSLPLHPVGNADFNQRVYRALFQHAGPYSLLDVGAR